MRKIFLLPHNDVGHKLSHLLDELRPVFSVVHYCHTYLRQNVVTQSSPGEVNFTNGYLNAKRKKWQDLTSIGLRYPQHKPQT